MAAEILHWPAHLRYNCDRSCTGCMICEGGLFSCTRCKGGEGSLPTDCPGEPISFDDQELIMAGLLDWINGVGWMVFEGPVRK